MIKKKRKVAIYVRVSTKDKGQDVENQLDQLRDYIERKDWTLHEIYSDLESGTKGRKERAGFDAMFRDAAKKKFDTVLFWALDRFTREGMYQTINYLQILDSHGVTFMSYTEEFLNTDNELVRSILLAVMSSLAQIEAKKISERTKAGLERARKKGKRLGKPSFQDTGVAAEIRALHKAGKSDGEIMRTLGISRNTVKKYRGGAHANS